MVAIRHVEAGAGHDQHVFLLQHFQRKFVVVKALRGRTYHAWEAVQRACRRHQRQVRTGRAAFDQGLAGVMQAATGAHQRANGIGAVQGLLNCELSRHVGAQAQRAEQIQCVVEVTAGQRVAAQYRPAHPPAAGTVHLRQSAEAHARQVAGQRRHRLEHGIVVQDAVVDFIDQQQQAITAGDFDDALQQCARVICAGRVVGVDQDNGAGA